MNNIIKIKPKCSALLDQNKFIDGDPLGHTCYNDASLIYKDNWFLCDSCFKKILNKDKNITLPDFNCVTMFYSSIENFKNSLKKKEMYDKM